MMNKKFNQFSYDEYFEILKKYREKITNLNTFNSANSFTILRHDVEFSTQKAYRMSLLESNNKIKSNYFFQVISDAYNISSITNRNLLNKIHEMGHTIGLHLYISHIKVGDWSAFKSELNFQREVIEKIISKPINCFSIHRPPSWVLENRDDEINGLINLYGNSYFEFSPKPANIKYLADSMHRWNYGHPLEECDYKKIQINIHPDHWSDEGYSEFENFQLLIEENKNEFIKVLDSETITFSNYSKKTF